MRRPTLPLVLAVMLVLGSLPGHLGATCDDEAACGEQAVVATAACEQATSHSCDEGDAPCAPETCSCPDGAPHGDAASDCGDQPHPCSCPCHAAHPMTPPFAALLDPLPKTTAILAPAECARRDAPTFDIDQPPRLAAAQ